MTSLRLETLGERLRFAIDIQLGRLGVSELERRLTARGIVGGSRTQLNRYINDKVSPTATFVVEVARELLIRPGWLLTGEGEMFADDTDPSEAEGRRRAADAYLDDMLPGFADLAGPDRDSLTRLAIAFERAGAVEAGGGAEVVGVLLAAPAHLLGVWRRLALTSDGWAPLQRYYRLAGAALAGLWDDVVALRPDREYDPSGEAMRSLMEMRSAADAAVVFVDSVLRRYADFDPAEVPFTGNPLLSAAGGAEWLLRLIQARQRMLDWVSSKQGENDG